MVPCKIRGAQKQARKTSRPQALHRFFSPRIGFIFDHPQARGIVAYDRPIPSRFR